MTILLKDETVKTLISESKQFSKTPALPLDNEICRYSLFCPDSNNQYEMIVDRRHGREEFKIKIQNSYFKEPFVRVELNAPPHHNNHDGTWTSRNHIHVYKEGFGMSIAYDLTSYNKALFQNTSDFNSVYLDFCKFCNIDTFSGAQYVI